MMALLKVKRLLEDRGLAVEFPEERWLQINVEQALITIEPRPGYCDRGNFIVKVLPRGDLALSLDSQDGFPRYYFGVQACADEVVEWMRVRQILPRNLTTEGGLRTLAEIRAEAEGDAR
jgi:hypothetical protein